MVSGALVQKLTPHLANVLPGEMTCHHAKDVKCPASFPSRMQHVLEFFLHGKAQA
jgi:hypothetical protein